MSFCKTFEIIERQKDTRLKALISQAESLDKDELTKAYVNHEIEIERLKSVLKSVTQQRNEAFRKLGEPERNMIDFDSLT